MFKFRLFVCLYNYLLVAGSFDYSPKFLDLNQGDSSDISDQGEIKILEDLAEAMNENLQINRSGNSVKSYYVLSLWYLLNIIYSSK